MPFHTPKVGLPEKLKKAVWKKCSWIQSFEYKVRNVFDYLVCRIYEIINFLVFRKASTKRNGLFTVENFLWSEIFRSYSAKESTDDFQSLIHAFLDLEEISFSFIIRFIFFKNSSNTFDFFSSCTCSRTSSVRLLVSHLNLCQ